MKVRVQTATILGLPALMFLVTGPMAWADIGPPIKINMPPDTLPAKSGVEYQGVFTVDVRVAGTLSDFEIQGSGWIILKIDVGSDVVWAEKGVFRIPFRAVPTDAEQLISLTLRYDGRKATRSLRIGPEAFARRGKDRPSVQVSPIGRPPAPPGQADNATPMGVGADETEPAGSIRGDLTLHFTGRIVYDRPTAMSGNTCGAPLGTPTSTAEEGVHGIWVEVINQNDVIDTTIRSLHTDPDGYFDTGSFVWSNCDPICDDPDIYVRWELDTPIVNVQDPSDVTEPDYSWSNVDDVITDFPGGFHDFGTLKPTDPAHMPALHIHNSVTRAHLFIESRVGITVPEVDVLWPDGNNASYISQEMKIGTPRQWNEGSHTHEYGHHFLENFAVNVEPDYCNDGTAFCDDGSGVPNCYSTPSGSCGHCPWCRETDHDAYNEGWPNWLADVVTRSYSDDYQFSDCTPWTAMCPRPQETISTCCQDGQPHDALLTEGFVGALLRDIEDDTQDDHDGDGIQDALCLGVVEIFTVAASYPQPITVTEFISRFLTLFPYEEDRLWPTAFNVDPSYISGVGFGADMNPPGAVTSLFSPTHPLGVGATMPCITVTWGPAADDVFGVCAYSYEWSQNPAGIAPLFDAATDIDFTGCLPSVTSGPFNPGDWYISIRAQECPGSGIVWSPQWSTFGPFTVTECNNNGILDVCEITCDISLLGLPCGGTPTDCTDSWPVGTCGLAQDCNTNLVPDDCDIDCNQNDRPDECDQADGTLIQWVGGSSSSWHDANNWHKPTSTCPPPPPAVPCLQPEPEPTCPALPVAGEDVCIDDPNGDISVVYSNAATQVNTLACYEGLSIAGGVFPWADLTLNQASWINGDLGLGGNLTVLRVVDVLDVAGLFTWTGGTLTGAGATELSGGMQLNAVATLDGHSLTVGNLSTAFSGTNWIVFSNGATLQVHPGATYNHQGGGFVFSGWLGDTFDNEGTFVKSAGAGSSTIDVFTDNSALIHVQAGTLVLNFGSTSTGDFMGDPGTTLQFGNGAHDLLAGSSVVADNVTFTSQSAGIDNVRGTYNVSGQTSFIGGHQVNFTAGANVINYGADLTIAGGPVYFDYVFGGPINFNSITVTANTAYFNGGDPINTVTLAIGGGTIRGPSDITVSGLMTWNASGGIYGPGTVNADGGLLVNLGGGAKTLYNRVLNNAGAATFLGSLDLQSSAAFNNLATGVIDIQVDSGGSIIGGSGSGQTLLSNAGTIVKTAGTGTSTISGPTVNTGTVEVQSGVIEFYTHNSGYYTQTAGQTVLNGGNLSMFGPAPVQIDGGRLTGAGTITGDVQINNNATAAAGLSAGVLDVVGTYTQAVGGTLEIEIDGLMQGSEYDLLTVSGAASLAGTLDVILPSAGFAPAPGDSFQILAAGSIVGQFNPVNVANLSPFLIVDVVYSATDVTLNMVGVVPGDCDLDGDADLGDYTDLEACLLGPGGGVGVGCGCFDFDSDGDVTVGDFGVFQTLFTGP